jgi:predicted RNA-binding Zn-ribbon protein involved in translation (DUF1610 family)
MECKAPLDHTYTEYLCPICGEDCEIIECETCIYG